MKTKIIPHIGINSNHDLYKHKRVWHSCVKKLCSEYDYNEYNRSVIVNLLYYINGQQKSGGYDINKGVMLCGNVGVGKSLIFKILHAYCYATKNPNAYRIESMESLKIHYKKKNSFDYFNEYKRSLKKKGINLCINEFGYDIDEAIYGVKFTESFKSFFMTRYELFGSDDLMLHATTNMNATEFKNQFDPPMYDRLKEMFNIIPLGGKSYRK